MSASKKGGNTEEIVDSGLGDSFPIDVQEGVETLTIHDHGEDSRIERMAYDNNDSQADHGLILESDQDGDK